MTSREYWQEREAEQLKKNIQDEARYNQELHRIYADMLDNIQKEIDSFYAKYASKEGITLAEAKRRAAQLDIDAYARKAKRYVKEKNFSDQANEEMRLYNLTMKVNRLELLKANLGLELVGGFDELQRYFDQTLTDRTLAEFRRQAGILGDSVQNNAQAAHAIVNASFHNATFSDRIWMYQDLLRNELDKQLQMGLIQGKGSRELARNLRKRFDVSQSDAERLMTTELRRVQTEVAKQSYERNGNEEYEFLATNPKGPCPICKALDGKYFPVKDMMPGKNAPPMHPRCRGGTQSKSIAKSTATSVVSALGSARSGAYSAGRNVGIGLANGMSSQLGRVRSVARQLASAAEAAIRAEAKIHSPSRVSDQLGVYWGGGYANGIASMARKVWQASEKLVAIPQLAAGPSMSYRGMLSEDYEYTMNAHYTIVVPIEYDGREVARVTAPYTEAELNKRQTRANRKNGIR